MPPREYISALYDWRNTSAAGLAVSVWVNNSNVELEQQGTVPPDVQRWAQPLNLATNAYLKYLQGPAYGAQLVGSGLVQSSIVLQLGNSEGMQQPTAVGDSQWP